jgi:hypothetical protein
MEGCETISGVVKTEWDKHYPNIPVYTSGTTASASH